MPRSNLSRRDQLPGPYRDEEINIDISSNDHIDERGFTVRAQEAGTITYRTLLVGLDPVLGDITKTVAAGDSIVGPGDVCVLCVAVRSSSTVATIDVGVP